MHAYIMIWNWCHIWNDVVFFFFMTGVRECILKFLGPCIANIAILHGLVLMGDCPKNVIYFDREQSQLQGTAIVRSVVFSYLQLVISHRCELQSMIIYLTKTLAMKDEDDGTRSLIYPRWHGTFRSIKMANVESVFMGLWFSSIIHVRHYLEEMSELVQASPVFHS